MEIFAALFIGFILTLFNMDYHLLKAVQEWTGKDLSISTYWAFWFIVGCFWLMVRLMKGEV